MEQRRDGIGYEEIFPQRKGFGGSNEDGGRPEGVRWHAVQ